MIWSDALAGQVAAALEVDDAILDGEIIAADETGRPVFVDLLRGTRSPCYVAFDLPWLNRGRSAGLSLSERGQAPQGACPRGRQSCPRHSQSRQRTRALRADVH
jgi:ATP-dependent DNA ligase